MAAGEIRQVAEAIIDPLGRDVYTGTWFAIGTLAVAMILLLIGLLRHPGSGSGSGGRSGSRLDLATVMAGAATAGLLLVQLPPGEPDLAWAAGLAGMLLVQPGIFLVVVFAVVRLIISGRSPFTRTTGLLSCLATGGQAVVQGVPTETFLQPERGAWLAAANLLTGALVVVAARIQERHVPAPEGIRRTRAYSWLPYGAMLLTWALGVGVLAAGGLTWRSWAVVAGAMITTALVVARQAAAFRHIGELLAERDELTARLTELAFHDGLTGLPNRALFRDRLAEALTSEPVTVFLVDLDDFKPVNDEHGHAAGDQLLVEVGRRLRACVRPGDTVARLGGDEFGVLVPGLDPQRRPAMAAELTRSLTGRVRLAAAEVDLRASIGTAAGEPGRALDSLLHEADMAMYAVKNGARAVRR
jgi:diguanylate cyclase (GGDEF)-like protein